MMDSQQIRNALVEELPTSGATKDRHLYNIGVFQQAAAEYADLLEASERVWWCYTMDVGYRTTSFMCDAPPHIVDGCGWRLLTPTFDEPTPSV